VSSSWFVLCVACVIDTSCQQLGSLLLASLNQGQHLVKLFLEGYRALLCGSLEWITYTPTHVATQSQVLRFASSTSVSSLPMSTTSQADCSSLHEVKRKGSLVAELTQCRVSRLLQDTHMATEVSGSSHDATTSSSAVCLGTHINALKPSACSNEHHSHDDETKMYLDLVRLTALAMNSSYMSSWANKREPAVQN